MLAMIFAAHLVAFHEIHEIKPLGLGTIWSGIIIFSPLGVFLCFKITVERFIYIF